MKALNKVLLVTYYWPPSGGVGVKRWLFFCNELVKNGITPVVLTPENPQFSVKDAAAEALILPGVEVLKIPIWEPFGLMQKLTGGKNKGQVKQGLVLEKEQKSVVDKLLIWMRGNLFIPDARKFWVKPASKFVIKYLSKHNVDAIITTGPPHSMHLIGRAARKKTGVKWVADFRDPWANWDLLDKLNTSSWGKKQHKKLEHSVLQTADLIVATSPNQASDLATFGAKKTVSINNGFAPLVSQPAPQSYTNFTILHMGLLNELRNPVEFWQVLEELLQEMPEFERALSVKLYGIIGDSVKEVIKNHQRLSNKVTFLGYVEQHLLTQKMEEANVLLAIQNRSANATRIIPYKLYEYLPMQRPILQLGAPTGDSNNLINELGVGAAVSVHDKQAIKTAVKRMFANWQQQIASKKNEAVNAYSHPVLAKKLIAELTKITHE